MGMTIDKAIPNLQFVRNALNDDMEIAKAYDLAIDTMRKYQQLQADYENRLKADLEAILVDLQLEIEENEKPISATSYDGDLYNGAFNDGLYEVSDIIQQKINSLKEDKKP